MRKEIVDAKNIDEAKDLMPWASVIVEVDSGHEGRAWMGFESVEDAGTWQNQE